MPTDKSNAREDAQRNTSNLDRRYGEIGISAVAAAIRFQCDESHERDDIRYSHYATD